jgi:hypothetical protein
VEAISGLLCPAATSSAMRCSVGVSVFVVLKCETGSLRRPARGTQRAEHGGRLLQGGGRGAALAAPTVRFMR